jgi:hypothetical protein
MNVFQTGEWMVTLAEGYGYTPCCLMYDGAGLPYMIDERFGIKNYFSMPFDTYGGVDSDDPFKTYYLTKAFAELPGIGYRYIVTYYPQMVYTEFQTSHRTTQIKDITPSIDDMWRGLHKDNRTAIRSTWRHDIHVELDESGEGRKLLLKEFPEKFLNALDYHMGRYYHPYVAKKDGQVVVASIMFLYGDTMTYWASTNTMVGRMCNANYMLLWTAIQDAHNAGCKEFNFGASPKGADSLVKFKDSWGTVTHHYDVHYIVPTVLRPFMRMRQWINGY